MICFVLAGGRICPAQTSCGQTGPDLIIGAIPDVFTFGALSGVHAYAVGTTVCNIGTQNAAWSASSANHPVIGQNLFRLKDGRFEQIGQAWARHPQATSLGNACACGCNLQGGGVLGAGCSHLFCCGANGGQFHMGYKSDINAYTGVGVFPYSTMGETGDAVFKRLQVATPDLDPAARGGGLYFVEAQCIAPDDASAGNAANNCTHRPVTPTLDGTYWNLPAAGPARVGEPALRAWKLQDPGVSETNVDISGDGRLILAARATAAAGGWWRYEYALQNVNSDRGVRSFSVPVAPLTAIRNVAFHDVPYHGGQPIDGADWAVTVSSTSLAWATAAYESNPNANALRWGTLYNFRFEANVAPQASPGPVDLALFKPGTPTVIAVSTILPAPVALAIEIPGAAPATVPPGAPAQFDVHVLPGAQGVVPGSPALHHRIGSGSFQATALAPLGDTLYRATLPTASCGQIIEYYLSAQGQAGAIVTEPLDAPVTTLRAEVGTPVVLYSDNFSTNQGWTTSQSNLTGGAWQRGVPIGGGDRGDPPTDFDGSGACWLTENVDGDSDVDGGPARLISPVFDLSAATNPRVRYAAWFYNDNLDIDRLSVEASSNGGTTWTPIIAHAHHDDWFPHEFRVLDYVALSATFRVRFLAADNPNNSITEAAVDSFALLDLACGTGGCLRGDVNGDFVVNAHDVARFVQIVLVGGGSAQEICAGDLQNPPDGAVGTADIPSFVACLLAGGCP